MLDVIYDATLLTNFFRKDSSRSGIFFVAKNVLDEMLLRDDVHVALYFAPERFAYAHEVCKALYPNVDCAQPISSCKWLCSLNRLMWRIHGTLFSHSMLRKPFALGIVFSQWLLKIVLRNKIKKNYFQSADVFFSPANKIPGVVRKFANIKPYVILHDAIPILYPHLSNPSFAQEVCENTLESDGVLFISKSTKRDFEKIYPFLKKCDGHVIPLAASKKFRVVGKDSNVQSVMHKYGIPPGKKYIFSLCSLAPHKNLVRNLRCFNQFIERHHIDDLVWVVGGGVFESFVIELKKQGVSLNSRSTMHIGYVDDEDLPVLYGNAEWFVYTSQYEGFGLPPLEAMQCGCPVIVSNNSSLPEVVGDAAILIDWDSDEQHIAAYEKYYYNSNLRDVNSLKGLERSKQFSWEKTVCLMINAMNEGTLLA